MFYLTNKNICHFLFVHLYERSALILHLTSAVEYRWEMTNDNWHFNDPL